MQSCHSPNSLLGLRFQLKDSRVIETSGGDKTTRFISARRHKFSLNRRNRSVVSASGLFSYCTTWVWVIQLNFFYFSAEYQIFIAKSTSLYCIICSAVNSWSKSKHFLCTSLWNHAKLSVYREFAFKVESDAYTHLIPASISMSLGTPIFTSFGWFFSLPLFDLRKLVKIVSQHLAESEFLKFV